MLSSQKLKEILVKAGYIKEPDFANAQKEAKDKKINLPEVLVERGLIKDENLGQLIADTLGFRYINLGKKTIKPEILKIIPEIVAKKQLIVAFNKDQEGLAVATNEPDNLQLQHFLAKKTGDKIIPFYATKAINYFSGRGWKTDAQLTNTAEIPTTIMSPESAAQINPKQEYISSPEHATGSTRWERGRPVAPSQESRNKVSDKIDTLSAGADAYSQLGLVQGLKPAIVVAGVSVGTLTAQPEAGAAIIMYGEAAIELSISISDLTSLGLNWLSNSIRTP